MCSLPSAARAISGVIVGYCQSCIEERSRGSHEAQHSWRALRSRPRLARVEKTPLNAIKNVSQAGGGKIWPRLLPTRGGSGPFR